jgi:hypothetical protein
MNRKKKKQNPGRNKKAFDRVMATFRKLEQSNIGCVRIGGEPGALYKIKTKPSAVEFRADVQKVVHSIVKDAEKRVWFWAAYGFDSPDPLDIEIFTYAMLGNRKHSWEQHIGKAFAEAKIFPTRGYFAERVGR